MGAYEDQRWQKQPVWAQEEMGRAQTRIKHLEDQLGRQKEQPNRTLAEGAMLDLFDVVASLKGTPDAQEDAAPYLMGAGIIAALVHQSEVTEALIEKISDNGAELGEKLDTIAERIDSIELPAFEVPDSDGSVADAIRGLTHSLDFPLHPAKKD